MIRIADQPIMARFGETVFLTEFVTPYNPDVAMAYQKMETNDLEETIWNCWQFVSTLPYKSVIPSKLQAGGMVIDQTDTWFYPAETIQIRLSNCANRTFLLASMLKHQATIAASVYGVFGQIGQGGNLIGNHAWVQVTINGRNYYIETTAPYLPHVLIPSSEGLYDPFVYFNDSAVFVTDNQKDLKLVFNGSFPQPGAIDWLNDYLSKKALPVLESLQASIPDMDVYGEDRTVERNRTPAVR